MKYEQEFDLILKERGLRVKRDFGNGADRYNIGLSSWDDEEINCCGFLFVFNGFTQTREEKYQGMVNKLNTNKLIEEKS